MNDLNRLFDVRPDVRLLERDFQFGAVLNQFARERIDAGGIVSFLGQVRGEDGVEALDLQHYAPLTLLGMEELANATLKRWGLTDLLIWHKVGVMKPGDPIVLVAAAAQHRRDAFSAVDYVMDHLKSDSWFWKREMRSGQWHWIEPRAQDRLDLSRWES